MIAIQCLLFFGRPGTFGVIGIGLSERHGGGVEREHSDVAAYPVRLTSEVRSGLTEERVYPANMIEGARSCIAFKRGTVQGRCRSNYVFPVQAVGFD